VRLLPLALAALALAGCETTAEQSARLEREAKRHAVHTLAATSALTTLAAGHAGTHVRALAASLVHSSEGVAAVVVLHNATAVNLQEVPVLITVKGPSGQTLYTNDTAGLSRALTGVALLPAHATLTWIDDQIQAAGTPSAVLVKVGDGTAARGTPAHVSVTGSVSESNTNGGTVEGTVTNHTGPSQPELVVNAVATRGGRAVAAGRGVLAQLAPGASQHFQLFLIGDPSGATLALSAPPTS
jgi:hypothetical protein